MQAHADTLAYRDELVDSAVKRRHELGVGAALTRPGDLVDLVDAVPHDPGAMELWMDRAGRIEAYREEWAVAREQLRERPRSSASDEPGTRQSTSPSARAVAAPRLEQDVELGIGMGW